MRTDFTEGKLRDYEKITLNVDGGCEPKNPGGTATGGWVLQDDKTGDTLAEQGEVVRQAGPLSTNNVGEYGSLCLALKFLDEQGWRGELTVKADSKLLVEQVNGRWKVKAPHLATMRNEVFFKLARLDLSIVNEDSPLPLDGKKPCRILWVPREKNARANDLCRAAYREYMEVLSDDPHSE